MIAGITDFLIRMLPGVFAAALLFAAALPPRRRRLAKSKAVSSPPRELALLVFVLFCGGLALLTLTPRWFHWMDLLRGVPECPPPFFAPGSVNLIPFRTFAANRWAVMILLGNVILFLPLGFFPPLLWNTMSRSRAALSGFCVSLFIEVWQLWIGRSFDVDDLLLNTLGVLLGHLLFRLLHRTVPRFTAHFRITNHGNEEPL